MNTLIHRSLYLLFLSYILALLAINPVQSQHHTHTRRCISYKPSLIFENWLQQKVIQDKAKRTTAEVITIPVVVHVIHNGEAEGQGSNISKAQIESQIRILNEDFRKKLNTNGHNTHPVGADTQIEFKLAIQSPEGIPTDGIVRVKGTEDSWDILDDLTLKALSRWNTEHYLNIWVCNLSLLGYAQFPETDVLGVPQNSTTRNPLTDGVVVNHKAFGNVGSAKAPFNLGRTTTHEVGHYLGLLHISGDGSCPTDDFCTDTPPVNNQNRGCPINKPIACNGLEAQIENYMDYTDDRCMNMFTEEQKTRMRAVLANSPRRKTLKDSPGLQAVILTPNNAGIAAITQIQNADCETNVIPKILIRNFGNNPLTSLTITYTIDQDNEQSFNWQGNLSSLDTTTILLPSSQTTRDDHQFTVKLSLPNGQTDSNPANNAQSQSFSVKPLIALPISYDFTDTTLLSTQWQIVNPDNKHTWTPITLPVQNQIKNNDALTIPFFDYPQREQSDLLTTPLLDVSTLQQLTLQFKVAYAPFKDGDSLSRDGLKVGVSTDCGKTFTTVYEKYSDTLATNGPVTESWKPIQSSQWRTEIVDLSDWVGKDNIQIAFIGINDYGNNIYIDDIELNNKAVFTHPDDFVAIYPNPSIGDKLQINLRLPETVPSLVWTLYDVSGRKVTTGKVQNARFQSFNLPTTTYLQGVYILKVSTATYSVIKRIVIY